MKKILLSAFLLILAALFCGYWFYKNIGAVSQTEKFSYFVIEKGTSATQVGNKLQSGGYIKSALAFKIYLRVTGQTGKLQAGEFKLSPSFTLFETINTLFKGPVELWVTIPEGLKRDEIAAKFATALNKNSSFTDEFLLASKGKEGYLFPDTYLFPRDATAATIVKKMTDTFEAKTRDLKNNSGLTFEQTIILASIIEKETKSEEERPIVAGILMNRLNSGIPLQVDVAPITYKQKGLPDDPIANPGLVSLKAAMNPTKTDYWYYLHDSTGQIHYAKTLSEHNANIKLYLDK